MLMAFAVKQFKRIAFENLSGLTFTEALPLVTGTYPQFYSEGDQRYLLYNDVTHKVERKKPAEVKIWFQSQRNKSRNSTSTSSNAKFLLKFTQLKF